METAIIAATMVALVILTVLQTMEIAGFTTASATRTDRLQLTIGIMVAVGEITTLPTDITHIIDILLADFIELK